MTRLPEEECAFYFAAMAQLDARPAPDLRRAGREYPGRLFAVLRARTGRRRSRHPAGAVGLWIPPAIEEVRGTSRWDRSAASFEKVSKAALPREEKRKRRLPAGHGYVPAY